MVRPLGRGRATTPIEERIAIRETVLDALAILGERQRNAIVLHYFEDLSVEETAQLMGTSTRTVKAASRTGTWDVGGHGGSLSEPNRGVRCGRGPLRRASVHRA